MPSDEALSAEEIDAWCAIPTAVITDELGPGAALDPDIRSLFGKRFAGRVRTIRTIPTPNMAAYETIEQLRPGDAILVDGRTYPDSAIWGGNMIAAATAKGMAGLVVDGNVRDAEDLAASGVAVHARRVQSVGWNWGGEIDVPITCGGVKASPHDLVVGDADGVVVIPAANRADLFSRCLDRIARDEAFVEAIAQGKSPVALMNERNKA